MGTSFREEANHVDNQSNQFADLSKAAVYQAASPCHKKKVRIIPYSVTNLVFLQIQDFHARIC